MHWLFLFQQIELKS